jgi:hypothetical protein
MPLRNNILITFSPSLNFFNYDRSYSRNLRYQAVKFDAGTSEWVVPENIYTPTKEEISAIWRKTLFLKVY